jgi:hypothetical protein
VKGVNRCTCCGVERRLGGILILGLLIANETGMAKEVVEVMVFKDVEGQ